MQTGVSNIFRPSLVRIGLYAQARRQVDAKSEGPNGAPIPHALTAFKGGLFSQDFDRKRGIFVIGNDSVRFIQTLMRDRRFGTSTVQVLMAGVRPSSKSRSAKT
jgi:hypothetical protein